APQVLAEVLGAALGDLGAVDDVDPLRDPLDLRQAAVEGGEAVVAPHDRPRVERVRRRGRRRQLHVSVAEALVPGRHFDVGRRRRRRRLGTHRPCGRRRRGRRRRGGGRGRRSRSRGGGGRGVGRRGGGGRRRGRD